MRFFFPGVIVSIQWYYNVARELILIEIKGALQEIGGHLGPLPRSFLSQIHRIKILR